MSLNGEPGRQEGGRQPVFMGGPVSGPWPQANVPGQDFKSKKGTKMSKAR